MYTSLLLLSVQCIQVFFVCSDATDRATRGLSMLRMGKRNLGLLRPSRSFSLPPLVPSSYDLPEDIDERQLIGSPRMGKNLDDYEIPRYESVRAPPHPRLGDEEEYLNEIRRALSSPDDEIRQIYASIPRAGRYLGRQKRSVDDLQPVDSETGEQMNIDEATSEHKEKRALPRYGLRDTEDIPFPRLGLYNRDSPFPRLGLYERSSILPRLGLRDEDEARSVTVPRLGLRDSDENEIEAEERALPRYGLRDIDEKRAMSMLRMGKREDEISNEKRAMSMLRMGKRGHMSMLRMGKRGMSMLRMGRSQPTAEEVGTEEQKRAVSMLRMGRSLGNDEATSEEEQKRAMSMLRMGKRGHMSMLRMGRSYEDDASNKRAVGMLRMGRGMSMLRMGKRSSLEQQEAEAEQKRAMSMLRMGRGMSMLRMGKRDVDEQEEEAMKVVADQDNTEVQAEG